MRHVLAVAAALCVAGPAFAQAAYVDASGATAGRSPHTPMREASRQPSCKAVYLPAGKLPTYGNPELDPRCQNVTLARAEGAKLASKD